MKYVLVTGATGQLGKCIQKIAGEYENHTFVFRDSKELDITNKEAVNAIFASYNFHFCINCAAFTNVDLAEKESKKAFEVNALGVKNIAIACMKNKAVLIHISTDYVFDGNKKGVYTTEDRPNPINEYGKSKLRGEIYVQEALKHYYIVRTSWLYSEYGKNFYKTILEKAKTEKTLHITDDQLGCPTDANHLARFILDVLISKNKPYGILHFTGGSAMTWYDFARKILKENGLEGVVGLKKGKNYRTFARRPKNSVLN